VAVVCILAGEMFNGEQGQSGDRKQLSMFEVSWLRRLGPLES
jgi:hypothetical protein